MPLGTRVRFQSQLRSHHARYVQGSEDFRRLRGWEAVLSRTRFCCTLFYSVFHHAARSNLRTQALRQTRFTEKIAQLGWLDPGFFDSPEDVKALQHCVVRYYGWVGLRLEYVLVATDVTPSFLTLIRENGSFSVPTLDIDLAWQYVSPDTIYSFSYRSQYPPTHAWGIQEGLQSICWEIC